MSYKRYTFFGGKGGTGKTTSSSAYALHLARSGARVLAVAFRGDRKIVSQANDVIYIPPIHTLFTPILAVIPMQLLAYYVAKANGCDIDKPKNLAKSVTVE